MSRIGDCDRRFIVLCRAGELEAVVAEQPDAGEFQKAAEKSSEK